MVRLTGLVHGHYYYRPACKTGQAGMGRMMAVVIALSRLSHANNECHRGTAS